MIRQLVTAIRMRHASTHLVASCAVVKPDSLVMVKRVLVRLVMHG